MPKIIKDGRVYGAAPSTLADLSDTTVSSPTNNQVLKYNASTQKWVNGVGSMGIELTQAEYDALENPQQDVDYYITDAPSMTGTAKELSYDGSTDSVYDKIEGLTDNDISHYTGTPTQGTTAYEIASKADKVTNGTYNFSGIWSPSFYSSRSIFIPFPNANDYTITLVRARYASDNTTMNDITSTAQIPTGGITEVGIQVTTTTNCDLKYGDIQLKFE